MNIVPEPSEAMRETNAVAQPVKPCSRVSASINQAAIHRSLDLRAPRLPVGSLPPSPPAPVTQVPLSVPPGQQVEGANPPLRVARFFARVTHCVEQLQFFASRCRLQFRTRRLSLETGVNRRSRSRTGEVAMNSRVAPEFWCGAHHTAPGTSLQSSSVPRWDGQPCALFGVRLGPVKHSVRYALVSRVLPLAGPGPNRRICPKMGLDSRAGIDRMRQSFVKTSCGPVASCLSGPRDASCSVPKGAEDVTAGFPRTEAATRCGPVARNVYATFSERGDAGKCARKIETCSDAQSSHHLRRRDRRCEGDKELPFVMGVIADFAGRIPRSHSNRWKNGSSSRSIGTIRQCHETDEPRVGDERREHDQGDNTRSPCSSRSTR